ncbi:MAG: siderophore-interacting protein [Alphaproteobacteria bacterium]|uniref:siderophore-interacting protein n=1 Tax=Brevundimonas TaxID=41275 RepID=UPI001DD4DEE7|nr:siderophore-interacting protein [Brevundimonas sp.]MBU1273606.1 siderophore-interacting protein [Alphaproteobacteria bacterium]MBU1521683.1 siderophore-interacting protein [Alphaproteobacteria bacterium]MBU2029915.1 siderophore-interacting protein [Alphaproteobacteria bacterium]MBU2164196.1 siderophore-interacting protein [Alphaproteobacteria bacterium]MBU2230958.1 siderophore-interacting protein [Alphaproteobacteria bacterium]
MTGLLRIPRRVRHELKFRTLTVASVQDLTPTYRRIVLEGADLEGFVSLGFDDHVKIFPVAEGQAPVMPTLGPEGPVFPAPRPVARDYTPRAYDAAARRLTLDFITGHGGPATEWAMAAKVGSVLGVGGPRGSFIVPTAFADHVLIGDETALPAIARRLEELPARVRAHVVVEVADLDSTWTFDSAAEVAVTWAVRDGAPRGGTETLLAALDTALTGVSPKDAYVWIAAESAVAKALRTKTLGLGFSPKAMKAAGYWRLGDPGAHEVIEG